MASPGIHDITVTESRGWVEKPSGIGGLLRKSPQVLEDTEFFPLSYLLSYLPCACGLVMTSQEVIDDRSLIQYLPKARHKGHFLICNRDVEWGKWPPVVVVTTGKLYNFLSTEAGRQRSGRSQAHVEGGSLDNGINTMWT